MNVLIDTSVWSIGLRRRKRDLNPEERKTYFEWEQLLIRGQAALIGPIRQEVLSGIVSASEFKALRDRLSLIEDLEIRTDTYVLAAEFFNRCKSRGIAAGPMDMTICAAGHEHDAPIFSSDPDFERYAKCIPISLYRP